VSGHSKLRRNPAAPRHARGFSLIELMISLMLGLLVVAGASGVFFANRRAYASTETLGRMQETARVAFELMARDIREAAGNPCGKSLPIANVLANRSTDWWATVGPGIAGGTGAPSAAGSDWIQINSATTGTANIETDKGNAANFKVTSESNDLSPNDIVMVCDFQQGAIFQVTDVTGGGKVVIHNAGSGSPGNCTQKLGFPTPTDCKNGHITDHNFPSNSAIAKLAATQWFVKDNGKGNALYRTALRNGALGAAEEVAEGIEKMTLEYLVAGATSYQSAAAVTAAGGWGNVTAVRITLDVEAREGSDKGDSISGTDIDADGKPKKLIRSITHVVTLRNRMA
jgi:type IV pilus assembly protein PilW